MHIIELVVKAGLFEPSDITNITPYKKQAALIRQTLGKLSQMNYWKDKNIDDIKVHTVDSMQGNEFKMVIPDFGLLTRFMSSPRLTGEESVFELFTNQTRLQLALSPYFRN